MSFDGTGTYNLVSGLEANLANGQTNDGTEVYAAFADVATALSTCITKNGQTTLTADLPLSGFRLLGVSAGSAGSPSISFTGDATTGVFRPSAGNVAISTNGAEKARIDPSGNLGLGITSPASKLHVYGASSTQCRIESGDDTGGQSRYINTVADYSVGITGSTAGTFIVFDNENTHSAYAYTPGGSGYHSFYTVDTERMRIAANGRIGIGTTSPSYALHVSRSSGNESAAITNAGTTISDTATFLTQADATTAQVTSFGDGTAYVGAAAGSGLNIGNSANSFTAFAQNATERMRLDTNGYLLVGYTSSNGAYRLQVNSQIFATNATVATSDARYKENVQSITGALGIIDALRPVSFRWRPHPVHDFDIGPVQLGFIAQEVNTALSGRAFAEGVVKSARVVATKGDRGVGGKPVENDVDEQFLGLAEGKLVPILAAALKELKAIVDAQAARIAALEAK